MDGEPLPSASDGSDEDKAKSAEQVYETVKLLWDDQVEVAASLKERRKLYATVIAATGAIGVFRISWTHAPKEVSAFACAGAEYLAKGFVVAGILSIGWACLYIFREGAVDSLALPTPPPKPLVVRGDLTAEAPEPPRVEPVDRSGRAICEIDLTDEEMEDLVDNPPHLVWLARAADLRIAYGRLVLDNNRVKSRLRSGLWRLGLGFGLLASAVITYTLGADRGAS